MYSRTLVKQMAWLPKDTSKCAKRVVKTAKNVQLSNTIQKQCVWMDRLEWFHAEAGLDVLTFLISSKPGSLRSFVQGICFIEGKHYSVLKIVLNLSC